ncbi:MAG: hypothetical protein WC516_06175 [Patescibacteria group bacterium]|jgi:hypothetical protein
MKMPNQSLFSIHKAIAKNQFNQLDYEGENPRLAKRIFINNYFATRTTLIKKDK